MISDRNEALKEKDAIMRTMQADIQQLQSENNRAGEMRQQLAAKEEECRQKNELVREKSATIRAQQAEMQWLRDQPAVPQKVG